MLKFSFVEGYELEAMMKVPAETFNSQNEETLFV